jgi:hypothetical protein
MREMRVTRASALALGALLAAVAAVGTSAPRTTIAGGGAAVLIYPLDCPTVQQCIDDASPGDTVAIAADGFIDESLTIGKTLTLDASGGYAPAVRSISVEPTSPAIGVVIERLRVRESVTGVFISFGADVAIRDSTIGGKSRSFTVSFLTVKPATLTIERSVLRSGPYSNTLSFAAQQSFGTARLIAVGNRITQLGAQDGAAGIYLDVRGTGEYHAQIMNNVIWDVARCEGTAPDPETEPCLRRSAIHAQLTETPDVDLDIVGNTIERSRNSGIAVKGPSGWGGTLALDVFDNILSHHPLHGIDIDVPGTVLRAGYNDLFRVGPNDLNGGSLGPGTRSADPRYVDRAAGDLRLRSSSPLIDRGQVCTPGGVADPDAAGNHRRWGPSVDIGGYERGAGPPTGQVLFAGPGPDLIPGTDGADIICGNGGGDEISGGSGNDYLDGGRGDDHVFGGSGKDAVHGRPGDDTLCAADGVSGNDRVDGGTGVDRYAADAGDTLVAVEQPGANCV